MTNEELYRNRLEDLAGASYRRQIPQFSDFLGLNEQNIFHSLENSLSYANPVLFGGYLQAERQMLGFLPDALLFMENSAGSSRNASGSGYPLLHVFPIHCIRIRPSDVRFSEPFSHRDVLGAVLNLGLERSRIGDILLGERETFLFAHQSISAFIVDHLVKIRHTLVHCERADAAGAELPKPKTEPIEGSVSSPRIDALIALAFHASRSSLKELVPSGKVFRNGRNVKDGSMHAIPGDVISVRGMGRFQFSGEQGTSKKGRMFVTIEKYI